MGFLDDLRKQADAKKQQERAEAARWQQLTDDYRTNIHPKMASLYSQLNEMIEHFKVVQPDISNEYILTASGHKAVLKQQEHKIVTDSADEMKEIVFTCTCVGDDNIKYEVENKKNIDKHVEYLQRYKLKFDSRMQRDDRHEISHAKFVVQPIVSVAVVIKGDIESGKITIRFVNVESLGVREHVIEPQQLDEAYVDNIIKYMVRDADHFLQLEMSESAKRKLQHKLKLEKLRREKEMLEAERRYEEEQKNNKK